MSVLLFLAVLFVLVLVHEFGHFIVARKTGMRVDEFGIGFPPRIGGWKRGETLYSLNAVPLGGFVKIFGEDAEQAAGDADSARAFGNRPLWAQALVLVAGVTANILLAWLLFSVAFAMGTKTAVSEAEASPTAELTVLSVLKDSPAYQAGIQPGDRIVAVSAKNDLLETDLKPTAVSGFIEEHTRVHIDVLSGSAERDIDLEAQPGFVEGDPAKKVVGITMGLIEVRSEPIPQAIMHGATASIEGLGSIIVGLGGLVKDAFLFRADLSNVAGPVGIAGLVEDAASFGIASLLMFTAFISLNLAVINLLPFPALDGGRLVFVIIEAIKGSPVPQRFSYIANSIGFVLLMLLMVAVTYNDILRIVS